MTSASVRFKGLEITIPAECQTDPVPPQPAPVSPLTVAFAGFGDLVGAGKKIDPFVLKLGGVVEARTFQGLEILNCSREPDLTWETARRWAYRTHRTDYPDAASNPLNFEQPLGTTTYIACDLLKVVDGKLALVMSDYEAKRIGLRPGDEIEVRQAFFTGTETKSSTPTPIKINGTRADSVNFAGYPINRFGFVGSGGIRGRHAFRPYPDGRAPVVSSDSAKQIPGTQAYRLRTVEIAS